MITLCWNWKKALVRAGISSGLVFLGALGQAGYSAFSSNPMSVLFVAGIGAGISFLSVLEKSESNGNGTTTETR